MHPAPQRPSDALRRVGVAAVVPAVAVAAHGAAGGGSPSTGGVVLGVAIGVLLALAWRPGPRSWRPGVGSTTLLLGASQVACHWALSLGDMHAAHHTDTQAMLATHLIAIPISALAIVGATVLADVLSSTIRLLGTRPTPPIPHGTLSLPRLPALAAGPVPGGAGVRGPPAPV